MTPEGKAKKKVKDLLALYPHVWYDMPVPSGYGKSTLDFIGCISGLMFAVETKAENGKLTDRQTACMNAILAAGGAVFVVRVGDQYGYMQLKRFLDANSRGAIDPGINS
jgi:hypothetical protein